MSHVAWGCTENIEKTPEWVSSVFGDELCHRKRERQHNSIDCQYFLFLKITMESPQRVTVQVSFRTLSLNDRKEAAPASSLIMNSPFPVELIVKLLLVSLFTPQ